MDLTTDAGEFFHTADLLIYHRKEVLKTHTYKY